MIVLATGGTGGHIFPALAVAEEARSRGLAVTVLGERGGMEERLVGEAKVPFVGVSAGKWHRGRPSPAHVLKAAAGVMEAWRFLRRERPDVVIGFGGFASFPGAVAASRLGIPLVLHEGNAYPSKVNRWLAGSAALVIAAQQEAFEHLPAARRRLVLPFPVRERRVDRQQARLALGLPTGPSSVVTLVMGGSQGSATLNREAPLAHARLDQAEKANLHVVHSAGRGKAATVTAATATPATVTATVPATGDRARYQVHDFLDAPTAWAAADLAITRAGIGTLSEAALNGVPLVMVPLPSSAEDHQLHNARAVAAAGAGLVVEERQLAAEPEALAVAWRRLLQAEHRAAAAAAAKARTPLGAARRILDAVMELK